MARATGDLPVQDGVAFLVLGGGKTDASTGSGVFSHRESRLIGTGVNSGRVIERVDRDGHGGGCGHIAALVHGRVGEGVHPVQELGVWREAHLCAHDLHQATVGALRYRLDSQYISGVCVGVIGQNADQHRGVVVRGDRVGLGNRGFVEEVGHIHSDSLGGRQAASIGRGDRHAVGLGIHFVVGRGLEAQSAGIAVDVELGGIRTSHCVGQHGAGIHVCGGCVAHGGAVLIDRDRGRGGRERGRLVHIGHVDGDSLAGCEPCLVSGCDVDVVGLGVHLEVGRVLEAERTRGAVDGEDGSISARQGVGQCIAGICVSCGCVAHGLAVLVDGQRGGGSSEGWCLVHICDGDSSRLAGAQAGLVSSGHRDRIGRGVNLEVRRALEADGTRRGIDAELGSVSAGQ